MNAVARSAYPTPRALALAGAGVAAAIAVGLAAPERWPLALLCGLFAALAPLADFALSAGPSRLEAQVAALSSLAQGAEADITVRAHFPGRAAPPGFEGALDADPRIAAFPRVRTVEDGFAGFRIRALRRGRARLERLQLRWTGPLGLMRRQSDLPLDHAILVTPDLAAARAAARCLGDGAAGSRQDVKQGQGGEFRSLRAYASGDDRRMIDWKRSASRGSLLVKEFQLEQNHPVVLALDTGRQMIEPVGGRLRLDQAVSAALALAYAGLAVGDRIRLCGFDAAMRADGPFVSGRGAFAALQAVAARLDASTEATNYTLALHRLAGQLDRRSLVVVFTEFTDTVGAELMLESVARLVKRHVVMFVVFRDAELEALVAEPPETPEDVSRAVVAASLLRDRALVLERLKRMGVRAVETTPERMGGAVIDAYLDLKRRELG